MLADATRIANDLLKVAAREETKARKKAQSAQAKGLKAARDSRPDAEALWRIKEAFDGVWGTRLEQLQVAKDVIYASKYGLAEVRQKVLPRGESMAHRSPPQTEQQATVRRFDEAYRRGAKDDVALYKQELDAYEDARVAREELADTYNKLLRAVGGPSIEASRKQYQARVDAEQASYAARAAKLERDASTAATVLLTGLSLYVVLAAANSEAATPAERQHAREQLVQQNNANRSLCLLQGRHYIEPFDASRAVGWCAI